MSISNNSDGNTYKARCTRCAEPTNSDIMWTYRGSSGYPHNEPRRICEKCDIYVFRSLVIAEYRHYFCPSWELRLYRATVRIEKKIVAIAKRLIGLFSRSSLTAIDK